MRPTNKSLALRSLEYQFFKPNPMKEELVKMKCDDDVDYENNEEGERIILKINETKTKRFIFFLNRTMVVKKSKLDT